jgi:hypothetical protein
MCCRRTWLFFELPEVAESIAKCLAKVGPLVDGVWKMETERVCKFIINDLEKQRLHRLWLAPNTYTLLVTHSIYHPVLPTFSKWCLFFTCMKMIIKFSSKVWHEENLLCPDLESAYQN